MYGLRVWATVFVALVSIAVRADESSPRQQLHALFADSWEFGLAEDPLFATHAGDNRYNDRLPRETLADQQRRLAAHRRFLARLEAIPRDQLERTTRFTTTSSPARSAMRLPKPSSKVI